MNVPVVGKELSNAGTARTWLKAVNGIMNYVQNMTDQ